MGLLALLLYAAENAAPPELRILLSHPNPEVALSLLDLCRICFKDGLVERFSADNRPEAVTEALSRNEIRSVPLFSLRPKKHSRVPIPLSVQIVVSNKSYRRPILRVKHMAPPNTSGHTFCATRGLDGRDYGAGVIAPCGTQSFVR